MAPLNNKFDQYWLLNLKIDLKFLQINLMRLFFGNNWPIFDNNQSIFNLIKQVSTLIDHFIQKMPD